MFPKGLIPNYGEGWRYAETISTAFVESTINQVVSKRMVKKHQMRRSQKGAHLLLQIRTRVLNHELREVFRQFYPSFSHGDKIKDWQRSSPGFFSLSSVEQGC